MRLQRFEVPGLSHYSYILASGGKAVVVDPKRDVDTYLDFADAHDLKITHILETHIHADYASGALELAKLTGAELWLSAYDAGEDFEYKFAHHEFREGEELRVGDISITALHTPGHTPEHLSFLVADLSRGEVPMLMLSGDFVFVGSLGRPDLLGEEAKRKLAESLYASVHKKLEPLPDGLEIHPAHGAGSMCGAGMSDRPQSTLGYERACNRYFAAMSRDKFVQEILGSVPPFPDYYKRMKRVNSEGPRVFGLKADGRPALPGSQAIPAQEFKSAVGEKNAVVIDLRKPEAFGSGHVPGAFNIGAGPNLSTWASWVVPYDRPIYLAGDDTTNYEDAVRSLVRVGLDEVRGYLQGGMRAWSEAGLEQARVPQIPVEELEQRLRAEAFVLDVRNPAEWNRGHIHGAQHIMGGELPKRTGELPKEQPIHVVCAGGYRSSVATSVLRRAGFKDVINVTGGMTAWTRKNLPVTEPEGCAVAAQQKSP